MLLPSLLCLFCCVSASFKDCREHLEKIQGLEGDIEELRGKLSTAHEGISVLQRHLQASHKRLVELTELSEGGPELLAEIRRSNKELIEGVKGLLTQPMIYYNSPKSEELEKTAVEFRPIGKHMLHVEKQALALMKMLDEARVAHEAFRKEMKGDLSDEKNEIRVPNTGFRENNRHYE